MPRFFTFFLCFLLAGGVFAQKRVLLEKFTTANCGSCPNGSLMILDLQEQYPGLIWVSHHKPTTWMDYPLQNEQSNMIWEDLNVFGHPRAMVDRTILNNRLDQSASQWAALVAQQSEEPHYADVLIKDVTYTDANRTFSFGLEVNFEVLPSPGTFHLTAIIVEDSIVGPPQNNYNNGTVGHPLYGLGHPIPNYIHNNVARAILDGPWGTANVLPDAPVLGETYEQNYDYTVPAEYDVNQIKVVAVLSYYNENNHLDKQVLNANQLRLSEVVDVSTSTTNILVPEHYLSVFPNPTPGRFAVQFTALPELLSLKDKQGRTLQTWAPDQLLFSANASDLPAGLYYLQAQYAQGIATTKVMLLK